MATKKTPPKKKPTARRQGAATSVAVIEVLPPEKALTIPAKSATLHFSGSEDRFVALLKEDVAVIRRHVTLSAYIALRVGLHLIWFRDNAPYGSLEPFLKKHFEESRRTLFNYIRVADEFLEETSLRNKQSHKLTDAKRIAPIIEQQLDLFVSPQAAKFKGVLKKVVDWVDDRGLTQIYKDIAASHDTPMPPSRKGLKAGDKRSKRQIDEEDFLAAYHAFRAEWEADHKPWRGLDDEVLADIDGFMDHAKKETTALLKQRK